MALRVRPVATLSALTASLLLVFSAAPSLAEPLLLSIVSAEAGQDPATGMPVVALKMTGESAKAFGDFTAAHVGHAVSILVDGEAVSSPVVREPIRGGEVTISGSMTEADAKALAGRIAKGKVSVDLAAD